MKCFLLGLSLLFMIGCGDSAARPNHDAKDANNTGINVRDKGHPAATPLDQGENQADIDITAKIRKQIVGEKMSSDANNVKIVTQNGRVTLRGPVVSTDEKGRIGAIAVQVAGEGKVDNQLEIVAGR